MVTRCLFHHLPSKLAVTLEQSPMKIIASKTCLSSQSSTKVSPILQPMQWRIMSAVCIERKPVLTQEMTEMEKKFSAMLTKLENERSMLSDHELRHKEDMKHAEKMKKDEEEDIDLDIATKQTAQDFEDASIDELQSFKSFQKTKNADLENTSDLHILERKLQSSLLLIVKERLGNDYKWILPQTAWKEGENLRESAERAIKEVCGDDLKVRVMGNAPCGFYKYKYPKVARDGGDIIGAKVFFFKAQIQSGNMDVNPNVGDYAWVTRMELKDKLQSGYLKAVENFLIDEPSEH